MVADDDAYAPGQVMVLWACGTNKQPLLLEENEKSFRFLWIDRERA